MRPCLEIADLRLLTGQCIDLVVDRGQIHCVGGPSGIGKSRLLRAIADLDPCPGTVALDGIERNTMSAADWRRQVMLVPAVSHWWMATARAHLTGDPDAWAHRLELSDDRLDAPVAELSTGERARAALLRALLLEPAILMLDEPTASLDEASRSRAEAAIMDYARDRAVIWISHDREQAQRLATHRWTLTATALQPAAA